MREEEERGDGHDLSEPVAVQERDPLEVAALSVATQAERRERVGQPLRRHSVECEAGEDLRTHEGAHTSD